MAPSLNEQANTLTTGVLCIDKPSGITSHDVVSAVRKLSHQRRVGHAGTLDPMATGVLLVCLGRATRISEYLVEGTKAYRAWVRFGQETNTWDADGEVTETLPVPALTMADIETACRAFEGEIDQVPPMFSAIKLGGQPLYKLARQGVEVERTLRRVQIHELDIVSWDSPILVLDVVCSKGTYIRSLAHDLGRALGTASHLAKLVRTRVGAFTLEQAIPLDQLQQASQAWTEHLYSMVVALDHLEAIPVSPQAKLLLQHGQAIELEKHTSAMLQAVDEDGALVAVLEPALEDGWWRPVKVLQPL